MAFALAVALLTLLPLLVGSAPLEDIVETLPDYGRLPTTQFSGFLNASAGCNVTANGNCYLHYWMALAEAENPMEKPVVLWFNGGPGSSSILGFLEELGPLLINATGGLMRNPWSWTKLANVIALEAPVGVGYSYCDNQRKGEICKNTDKFTASASRAALQDFFANKFPELGSNDVFITGESYAGVYIPTLTKEILDNAPEINIKGIAVGDPCTDTTAQENSMDSLWYGYKYGLVDEAVFDLLWYKCQVRSPNLMQKGGVHLVAAELNRYLYEQGMSHSERLGFARDLYRQLRMDAGPKFRKSDECVLAHRKFLMSSSYGLSQSWKDLYVDDYSLFSPVTNQQDDDMAVYMSRADVRKALHVESSPAKIWPTPRIGFDYTKEYDACNHKDPVDTRSMIDFYRNIVPRLQITFIYNGDTDPCVSYEGTRTAVKRIGFAELDGGSYRPWFYNESAAPLSVLAEKSARFGPNLLFQEVGAQMGGEVVSYDHGLSFLTVHGSGHMVPQFRPQAALHMLDRLVHYQSLSPLMPSNETLTEIDTEKFHKIMDEWTEKAKSKPFVTSVPWAEADIFLTPSEKL